MSEQPATIDQPAAIQQIHDEIVAILVRMKKPTIQIDRLIKGIEKRPPEMIKRIYVFLSELYFNEFTTLREVWTLPHISDTMWHSYKLLRIKGLPEQESLHVAWDRFYNKLVSFRKALRAERKANENLTASDSKRIRQESVRRRRAAVKSNSRSGQ